MPLFILKNKEMKKEQEVSKEEQDNWRYFIQSEIDA